MPTSIRKDDKAKQIHALIMGIPINGYVDSSGKKKKFIKKSNEESNNNNEDFSFMNRDESKIGLSQN